MNQAPDLRIRPAETADFEAILDLWEELMRLHAELDPIFTIAQDGRVYYRHWLRQCQRENEAMLWVAERAETVVGYALAYVQHMPPSMHGLASGLISDVCVREAFRSQGIGRALFATLEREFRALGITRLEVKTSSFNAQSNHFWQNVCGFHEFVRMQCKELAATDPSDPKP